jgi:hypothetical protein
VILFSTNNRFMLIGLLAGAFAAFVLGDHLVRFRVPLWILSGVMGAILLVTVLSVTALGVGLGIAVVLAAMGLILPRGAVIFVLNFLALIVGLNAIMDIWFLFGNMDASLGAVRNDASAMGQYTNISGTFWAVLWVILAAGMMLSAAYLAFIQPLRRKQPTG